MQNNKNWKILDNSIADSLDSIIKILLANRGLHNKKEIENFLNPSIKKINYSNIGIDKKSLHKATQRIENAIKLNEKIIIFGDYDVDGVCASAILWETLYKTYKNVLPYIPHRENEGYGLSIKGLDNLLKKNPDTKLIITVDNGIVAYDAIKYATSKKIDVIVTDHHVGGKKKTNALATIHSTKLCGAGVALMLALAIEKKELGRQDERLDLVALATVADLVPLTFANRTLLKFGIEKLRKTKRVGLLALFEIAALKKEDVGVYELGHIIGPRLNAAGRITHAVDGLRLLCTKSREKALDIALELNKINKQRQFITEEMIGHATSILKVDIKKKIVVVYDKNYNQGIIGLVASRLMEVHYKPAFVLSVGEKIAKGSARSIKGFDIIEFIRSFDSFLLEAGGHPMAAGFSVKTEKLESFKLALEKKSEKALDENLLTRTILIDTKLDFRLISYSLYNSLQKLAPFGMGNPQPLFLIEKVLIKDLRLVGKNKEHAKILLEKNGIKLESIFFGFEKNSANKGSIVDIVCSIELNKWNGRKTLQLRIKDIKKSNTN